MIQGDENMTRWLAGSLGPGPWMRAALLMTQASEAETVLVTGASSALGQDFARQYEAEGWAVTATESPREWCAEQFGNVDYSLGETVLQTNVLGPLSVSESFIRQIGASQFKKIVSITSTRTSLRQPIAESGATFYRASKAGRSRAVLVAENEIRPQGITVLLTHPGTVQTETRQFGQRVKMDVTASRTRNTVADVTMKNSGRSLLYDGSTLPW